MIRRSLRQICGGERKSSVKLISQISILLHRDFGLAFRVLALLFGRFLTGDRDFRVFALGVLAFRLVNNSGALGSGTDFSRNVIDPRAYL